jgi:uncharacterized protein YkwD
LRSTLQHFRPKALLVALALVLALVLSVPAPVAADTAGSVLASINASRAKAGCPALKLNAKLMAAAEGHARAMAEKDFFGHRDKAGRGFTSRIRAQGYRYGLVAENIAAGQTTAAEVVRAWLESPGHRKNILNCKYRETGIAMVYQPGDKPLRGQRMGLRYYWVQVFGLQR